MRSFGLMIGVIAVVAAVCLFLGIDLASSGLERVQGSLSSTPVSATAAPQDQPEEETPQPPAAETDEPATAAAAATLGEPAADAAAESLLNRALMGFGDALRYIAKGAIRFFADLFSAVMH